jgi:hypothetical protein
MSLVVRTTLFLAALVCASGATEGETGPAVPAAHAYAAQSATPSARVLGARRLDDTTIRRKQFTGDNWHTAWAADGHQYVLQCDGQGFNTRLWRLRGSPPDFTFEPVASHPGPQESDAEAKAGRARYYGFGTVALGDALYHFYSTPNTWYRPPYKFVGAKLIYSPDGGATWNNGDGTTPVVFEKWDKRTKENTTFFNEPDDCFALLTILQMGRGYAENRDGFLYVYAPNGSTEGTMNQLVLFRVPKERLRDRAAYEYFAGPAESGRAKWSKRIEDRRPLHTFPSGWVNKLDHPYSWHPSVVYNAPLGVYMMANWGVGTDASGRWFTKPSYLGLYMADQPWGPWRQVHEETAWFPAGGDPGGQCYQPQIMPGWVAADGKSFWLAWTQFPKGYYFQCQKVELVLR